MCVCETDLFAENEITELRLQEQQRMRPDPG